MARSDFYQLFGFAAQEDRVRSFLHRQLVRSTRSSAVAAVGLGSLLIFTLLQLDLSFEARLAKLALLNLKGMSPFYVTGSLKELLDYGEACKRHSWNMQVILINRITDNLLSQAYRKPKIEACSVEESLVQVLRVVDAMRGMPEVQESQKVNEGLSRYVEVLAKHYSKRVYGPEVSKIYEHLISFNEADQLLSTCIALQRTLEAHSITLSPLSVASLAQKGASAPCKRALLELNLISSRRFS
mmetsp:Transcript_595/g.988  ORF Transcript_595/g.988 Transcript_595/m.988 type:complete len:242 (+) Transcript_595:41-766(+)